MKSAPDKDKGSSATTQRASKDTVIEPSVDLDEDLSDEDLFFGPMEGIPKGVKSSAKSADKIIDISDDEKELNTKSTKDSPRLQEQSSKELARLLNTTQPSVPTSTWSSLPIEITMGRVRDDDDELPVAATFHEESLLSCSLGTWLKAEKEKSARRNMRATSTSVTASSVATQETGLNM